MFHCLGTLMRPYWHSGLKVNDQLVAYATRFLAVRLKNHVWSHHRALKAKVQCDFSSAYLPDHTNVLRFINIIIIIILHCVTCNFTSYIFRQISSTPKQRMSNNKLLIKFHVTKKIYTSTLQVAVITWNILLIIEIVHMQGNWQIILATSNRVHANHLIWSSKFKGLEGIFFKVHFWSFVLIHVS